MLFDLSHILINNYKPVRFWGYTSYTTKRIISIDLHSSSYKSEETYWFNTFRQNLVDIFLRYGIKAYLDNKIVFELENPYRDIYHVPNVFIGFHDWVFSVGLNRSGDNWVKPHEKGSITIKVEGKHSP